MRGREVGSKEGERKGGQRMRGSFILIGLNRSRNRSDQTLLNSLVPVHMGEGKNGLVGVEMAPAGEPRRVCSAALPPECTEVLSLSPRSKQAGLDLIWRCKETPKPIIDLGV